MFVTLFLIVLIIGYSVIFVVKSLVSNHDDVKGTPVTGEVFPKIDIFNQADSLNIPQETEAFKPKAKKNTTRDNSHKTVLTTPDSVENKNEKTGISLKSRSEAKRAFIHAEIFNRKY